MRVIDRYLQDVIQRRIADGDMASVRAIEQFRAQMGVPPQGAEQVRVVAPNGETFTFPTQADADNFKRVAGIP